MMNQEQSNDHENCPRCIGTAACLFGFYQLLRENEELRATLEERPARIVHFVIDLHSLQAHAGETEWMVYEDGDLLMVVDTKVKDPSAHLVPMARMVVTSAELLGEIDRIARIIARRKEKDVAVC